MDPRLKDQHILGGSLNPASFSEEERSFLAKNLGKKKAAAFDGPVQASVDFAMEWAAEAGKEEVKHAKAAMVPSAPPADSGKGGGNSAPTRKKK